jgi:DNA-3-methyladenine glycosylase
MLKSKLNSEWFARPAERVAPDLLGCTLVRKIDGILYRGLIVETEAYDATDPACHGYKRQTERNKAIFGEPGTIYVYLIYGIYHCVNIVCDHSEYCSAVLLRALELDPIPEWINPKEKQARVAAGPGKLCRALKIDRSLNGVTLSHDSNIWIESQLEIHPESTRSFSIVQTTRIGLTQGADIPWRWYIKDHPAISKR